MQFLASPYGLLRRAAPQVRALSSHRRCFEATTHKETDPMTVTTTPTATADRIQPVAFDLLRDIHKAIRAALFAVTAEAGRVDSSDDLSVAALEAEVRDVARMLAEHAAHEDDHLGLGMHLPDA